MKTCTRRVYWSSRDVVGHLCGREVKTPGAEECNQHLAGAKRTAEHRAAVNREVDDTMRQWRQDAKDQAKYREAFVDIDVRVSNGRVSVPKETFDEVLVHIGDHLSGAAGPRLEEYFQAVQEYRAANPGQRVGQAFFNVLCQVRPDISERVRGSYRDDPFHDDAKLPEFLEAVTRGWGA